MDFSRRAFGYGEQEPWRDTMQVCLDGHVITDSLVESPHLGKKRCPKDGTETISACPTCGNAIPGTMHYAHSVMIAPLPPPPERCEHCGEALPWTGKRGGAKSSVIPVDDVLPRTFERFSLVVKQLRQRHDSRETLDVKDEYDVQDLLHALLRLYWDDVREEQWTPSYAGKAARVDFLLPTEQAVIEVKMTRKGLTHKELGDQLIVDIARYGNMKDCSRLYCFVHDPDGYIKNPRGVESDLEKQSTKSLKVRVFIR
jgi:hypothetical protein